MRTKSNLKLGRVTSQWALATLIASLAACGGGSRDSNYTAPGGAPTAAGLTTGGGAGPAAPSASPGAPASAPAPGPVPGSWPASAPGAAPGPIAPASPPLGEQISALERSGAYPALDRSNSIAGPDANRNGVRDDVEAWVNAQPLVDVQRKALLQKARALQQTLLVDLKDKAALQRVGEGLVASSNCGGDVFSPYIGFSQLAGKIEAMTANTKERAVRYMQYNAARSGSSTTLPNGNTCEP
jgi:hypothetical protein